MSRRRPAAPAAALGAALLAAALVVGCSSSAPKAAPGTGHATSATTKRKGGQGTQADSTGGLQTPSTLADGSFPPVDKPHTTGTLAKSKVKLTQVAKVDAPTTLVARPGHADELLVAERSGKILLAHPATSGHDFSVEATNPLLDLSSKVGTEGEEGLLGLAFNRAGSVLYVSYNLRSGDSRLVAYPVGDSGNGPTIDATRPTTLLAVRQPYGTNHKGGDVQFGPDGYLYWGLGDGGDEGDPHEIGQDPSTMMSKILRIDPAHPANGKPYGTPKGNPFADGRDGLPETFISGLRNPWRFSFDPTTGDLWIGDVGQSLVEEVDRIPAGKGAGANLGWSGYEGTHVFAAERRPARSVPPLFEQLHVTGACAITGGVVYRGTAIHELQGAYVFADYCHIGLEALRADGSRVGEGTVTDQAWLPNTTKAQQVESIGTDAAGNVYALGLAGQIWRLDPG